MPNKHFCQGPTCHEKVTQDRFLKSRGVIRGRYANLTMNHEATWYKRSRYFCSTTCEGDWLNEHMTAIEMRIPVPFITYRRESKGYTKVKNEDRWGGQYRIERVDNWQAVE